jgi:acetyl esterase/lipase
VRPAEFWTARKGLLSLGLVAGLVILSLGAVWLGQMTPTAEAPMAGPTGQVQTSNAAPTSSGVQADEKDVVYKSVANAALKLDLHPASGAGPHPLIVWVHGGGWQSGDKSQCLPTRLGFAARGYTVACVNYRLSGAATFPAQIEDVRDAIAFLRANAARYRLDPRRFVAWGSSAGGHLVALAGTTSGQSVFTSDGAASAVQAVIDFYGPTDLFAMAKTPGYTSHAQPDSAESALLGGPVIDNPDKARLASPITYVSAGDPPFLIVHGTADPVVPQQQSQLLYDALRAAAVPAQLNFIAGAKHGGPEFSSQQTTDLVLSFLQQHL